MPEMANAGEDHGQAEAVGGGDDILIFDGTTRLDDGGCAPACDDGFKAVGEGEEGVRGGDAVPARGSTAFMAPEWAGGVVRLIWPAPMPRVWPSRA